MYSATISPKGQITLPAAIRKRLGVQPNDRIALILRGEEILLKPLKGTIRELRGAVEPRTRPEDFERIRRRMKDSLTKNSD